MFHSNNEIEEFVEQYNDMDNNPTIADVGKSLGLSERSIRRRAAFLRSNGFNVIDRSFIRSGVPVAQQEEQDEELLKENVRLMKKHQKQQDLNRVERKSFREYARVENAIESYVEDLKDCLEEQSFHFDTITHPTDDSASVGVVHLSDLHLNEEIDLPHNKYNFSIASARLKKYAEKIKQYFNCCGISDVMVMCGGDMLNSDRRFDEMLTNSTNRANATFLAVDIIQQFLRDLNEQFNLTVISVTGNESRIDKDIGWERAMAQNNFDFMIHNMLSYLFKDKDGINFIECESAPLERVIDVNGTNVLLIHGHNGLSKNPEKKIMEKKSQYADADIQIDFVLMGHIHCAQVSDLYSRSSGLPGANSFSQNALNLSSRASQNIHIFNSDGSRESIVIDLQNVDEVNKYAFESSLEAYNNKLAKTNSNETVIKIVI